MVFNNVLIFATYFALIMVLITSGWRFKLVGLAIIYLISFIVILQIWPVALASVKLIAGWMGIILISASQYTQGDENKPFLTIDSQSIFRLLIAALVWIMITAEASAFNEWLPIPYTNLYLGLTIVGGGLIYASVNKQMFDVILGVLTLLAGFDIIYSSLEGSALVTGIFAIMIILISLLNSYFSPTSEDMVN